MNEETIRNEMVALKEEFHVTQQQVADLLGITKSFYSRMKSGVKPISQKHWNKIHKFYLMQKEIHEKMGEM